MPGLVSTAACTHRRPRSFIFRVVEKRLPGYDFLSNGIVQY